jgi:C1A family cysteine protease
MAVIEPVAESARITPRKVAGYGWHPDLPDHRDRIYNDEDEVQPASALPPMVDLSPHMPPIYDQGQLGSCTGNGIARVFEYEAMAQSEAEQTPSRLFIYYNERAIEGTVSQDSGGQVRDGIKVVHKLGAPPETLWPYSDANPGPFEEKPPASVYAAARTYEALVYKRILPDAEGNALRSALAANHPVVFGFSVPAYFEPNPAWNPAETPLPLPGPNDKIIGGHCVVISGYDYSGSRFAGPAFQIDNSWGTQWGIGGRFWMDAGWFDPKAGLARDFWVITQVS